jgi:hypothetical protein
LLTLQAAGRRAAEMALDLILAGFVLALLVVTPLLLYRTPIDFHE